MDFEYLYQNCTLNLLTNWKKFWDIIIGISEVDKVKQSIPDIFEIIDDEASSDGMLGLNIEILEKIQIFFFVL